MSAGDVLLFHRKTFSPMTALIHLTTRSKWNHAALDIGDGMMVEATSSGVRVNPISSSDEIHRVEALHGAILDLCGLGQCELGYQGNDLEEVLAWGTGRVGWRYGYATAFLCGLRHVFPGFGIVQDKAIICSQLVAEALERGGHYFDKDSAKVSPGDLAEHFGVPR
jgi:uncharacterized protein YycO